MARERNLWWVDDVVRYILDHYGMTLEDALATNKLPAPDIRKLLAYYMQETTELSLAEIGELLGGRSHATILLSIRALHELIDVDAELKRIKYYIDDKKKEERRYLFSPVIDVLKVSRKVDPWLFDTAIKILKQQNKIYEKDSEKN